MSADAFRLALPRPFSASADAQRPGEDATSQLTLAELIAPERWSCRQRAHPELRKSFAVVQAHLSETRRLLALPARGVARHAAVEELTSLLRRNVRRISVDGSWELAGELKRLNLRLGDRAYIRARLEYERTRNRTPGQWHTWSSHFDLGELRDLLTAYRNGRPTATQRAHAVERLTSLYLMRDESGRNRRARGAIKCFYLTRLAIILFALLVGLGLAMDSTGAGATAETDAFWKTLVLAACAGALGSTLSGVFKVRDQLVRLDELRGFWPAMRVQPFVGACAGLILVLVVESNAVKFGWTGPGWAGRALLAFAAGFSEPFFLGIVQRVAVVPDPPAAKPAS